MSEAWSSVALVVVAVLASSSCAVVAQRPAGFDSAWAEVARRFHDGCEQAGVVGASLAFVHGRDLVAEAHHGFADLATRRPADLQTIYHWASITKTLTGIACMQLRDRQRLTLDEPVVRWLPELAAVHDPFGDVHALTLRLLLSHSAGFRAPTWPWGGDRPWQPYEPTRYEQLVAMMPYTELQFPPGSKFSYSNLGIVFAGRVIELLSGDDWEVYVDKNVLRPLGMTHSYFDVTPYHLLRYRSNHYRIENGEPVAGGLDFDTGVTVSNGGLNAPLADMVRYLAFLTGDVDEGSDASAVLARDSLGEMLHPQQKVTGDDQTGIGITFFLLERGGRAFFGHTGHQQDFVSFFYVHAPTRTAAIGSFNTATATPVMLDVRRAAMDLLTPLF